MKGKIILLLSSMLLVGLAVFVSASMSWQGNGPNVPYKVELELNKGWNIIAGTLPEDGILSDSEIQASDIKAMWYYSPKTKEYKVYIRRIKKASWHYKVTQDSY